VDDCDPFWVSFSAHLAIMLMLHNRVTEVSCYNRIIARYITLLNDDSDLHCQNKQEMIPFYTALLLGESAICVQQAIVLVNIKDDAAMS
jgi:hypothetical protein